MSLMLILLHYMPPFSKEIWKVLISKHMKLFRQEMENIEEISRKWELPDINWLRLDIARSGPEQKYKRKSWTAICYVH
jgi:hypothetical protein